MRISDWSSDVCSSDLPKEQFRPRCHVVKRVRPACPARTVAFPDHGLFCLAIENQRSKRGPAQSCLTLLVRLVQRLPSSRRPRLSRLLTGTYTGFTTGPRNRSATQYAQLAFSPP